MKFEFNRFSRDVDVFRYEKDIIIRFYDSSKKNIEEDIVNLVILAPSFGYLC